MINIREVVIESSQIHLVYNQGINVNVYAGVIESSQIHLVYNFSKYAKF